MRPAIVLLLALAACVTGRGRRESVPPPPAPRSGFVALTLAWPDAHEATSTLEETERDDHETRFTLVRSIDRLRRHGEGWVSSTEVVEARDSRELAARMLERISPVEIEIGPRGECVGLLGADRMVAAIRELLPPTVDDPDALLRQFQQELERGVCDDLRVELGRWVGAELELGRTYEAVETRVAKNGEDAGMQARFGAEALVPCFEGGPAQACVRLRHVGTVSSEDVARVVGLDALHALGSIREDETLIEAELTRETVIVTEPATLLHHGIAETETLRVIVADAAGAQRTAERVKTSRTVTRHQAR